MICSTQQIIWFLSFLACCHSKSWCQPDQTCWPSQAKIQAFADSLASTRPGHLPSTMCSKLPTFSSQEDTGVEIENRWYPEEGEFITPYDLLTARNKVSD